MALLRLVALLTLTGVCQCLPPDCSYRRLWEHLNLTASNSFVAKVRPVQSWQTPTYVFIDMVIYSILKVDEKSQTVEGATWTTVRWLNEFMVWDPKDFCGISVITVPRSMVWIPDLQIEEDVTDSSRIKNSPFVSLNWKGWTLATTRDHITFTCQLDLKLFPFDEQNCNITFTSMISDASVIKLTTIRDGTQLTNASEEVLLTEGEWDLTDITISRKMTTNSNNVTRSNLVYSVMVSRKPTLYVINFIVPLCVFLVLDLASFFINEAQGEKLSFKVTILLSISVLLLILKDMLPSTENMMPCIANYCLGIFAMVGLSVLEAMVVSFLFSFKEKVREEPQTCSNCEDDIHLEKDNSKVSSEQTKASPPPVSARTEAGILWQILHQLKTARKEMGRATVMHTRPRFRKIAIIIDSLYFVLYCITVIVFVAYMCEVWAKRYFLIID